MLDDSELPAGLIEAWQEDENNAGQPFPSYARLLPSRGTATAESRYSWTIDFAARRKQAREEMHPYLTEAERLKTKVVVDKANLKLLKKTGDKDEIEALERKISVQEKAAREAQNKATAIDAAVFDLKAVNPNSIVKVDTRTPEQVIESIEAQGKIVADALKNLRTLLQT